MKLLLSTQRNTKENIATTIPQGDKVANKGMGYNDDPRAQRITRRVGEIVAIDCHPLSVTEDVGFNRVLRTLEPRYNCPGRKYFMECVVPKICPW